MATSACGTRACKGAGASCGTTDCAGARLAPSTIHPVPSSSANDAYDTIDWIVAQNWSNGVVYLTGVSADGLEDFATISNPHPAARAQFAMWAGTSGYDMIMPGGAIRESLVKDWLSLVDLFNASAVIAEAYSHEAPDRYGGHPPRGG